MSNVSIDRRLVRIASFATGACLLMTGAWAQGTGLTPSSQVQSPKFQARLGLNTSSSIDGATAAWHQQAGVLLGDYYFSRARLGSGDVSGGFRATGGVLMGQRSLALGTPALAGPDSMSVTLMRQARQAIPGAELASEPWSTLPYLGVGWSGGSLRGGWGVSADFGFAARAPAGGLRVPGTQALEDVLREFRLTPVLHVGVSYAF